MLSLGLVFEVEVIPLNPTDPSLQAVVRALAAGVNEGASCSVTSCQLEARSRSHLEHDSRLVSSYPVDTRHEEHGGVQGITQWPRAKPKGLRCSDVKQQNHKRSGFGRSTIL